MEKGKMYLMAVVAVAAMASCSSGEEQGSEVSKDSQITFGTYVDMNSRALEKSAFSVGDELCINAFEYSGTTIGQKFTNNFMQNEVLEKTSTGWTYTNAKFWPVNTTDRVSFVGSYPNIAPTITDGICTFDFSVNANPALQQDFMWCSITDAYRSDRNGTHQNGILENPATTPIDNVVLHFRHALSKVIFRAKAVTAYTGATITITDIVVNNLYGAGSYSLTENLGEGTWVLSGNQNQNYTVLTGGTDNVIDTYYKTFGESLLVMPQTLNTTSGSESTVTIKYKVQYSNPSSTVEESRTFNLAHTTLTDGNKWEQDKVYNYNFNIALDMITFDAVISSWDGSTSSEITVE